MVVHEGGAIDPARLRRRHRFVDILMAHELEAVRRQGTNGRLSESRRYCQQGGGKEKSAHEVSYL
jgi:hypothetical protein